MDIYIIIVAAGKGKRLGGETLKQFQLLDGKPVVMQTFEAFRSFYNKATFLLVLPGIEIGKWRHLCAEFDFSIPHEIIEGGPTRFHSVKNALSKVPEKSLVFIHDAVRPLVDEITINNCLRTVKIHGNAIPVTPVTDSLRVKKNGLSYSVKRENYQIVQTPQVFTGSVIKKAYQQTYNEDFTDDSSVAESAGVQIRVVEGNPENIKITHPGDLGYAQIVWDIRKGN